MAQCGHLRNSVSTDEPGLERLLDYLRAHRGFDFTGYRRATLRRRIDRRMQALGLGSYEDYIDWLEVDPSEFEVLFNLVLINVTGFMRDPQVWEHLRTVAVPALLAERGADDPSGHGRLRVRPERRPAPWRWSWRRPWGPASSAGG